FLRAFVLAIQTLSESFSLAFQVLRFRVFPFRRFRLYQWFSFSPTTLRRAGKARRKGVEIEIITA
ncbi:hypothetical protein, partial [Streptomyces sp. NPDC059708]|uniref:hypothetical protein n=1 Tax=Streptomyces sp. NPDC059708 TaxID=3346916 RepID=UPI00368AFC44